MNIDLLKYILILTLIIIMGCKSGSNNQNEYNSCETAKKGEFTYSGSAMTINIYRNDSTQTDKVVRRSNGDTYYLKSRIDWNNLCEYNLTLISSSTKYKHKPGSVLNVKIDGIQGNTIFYTKTINGKSEKGKMRKVN